MLVTCKKNNGVELGTTQDKFNPWPERQQHGANDAVKMAAVAFKSECSFP